MQENQQLLIKCVDKEKSLKFVFVKFSKYFFAVYISNQFL